MPRFLVDGFVPMQELVASVPGTAMQFDIYHLTQLHRAGVGEDPLRLLGSIQLATVSAPYSSIHA